MNQNNIIVVLGDLGAGSNFVKNVLLLSPDVDFPWTTAESRFDFIKNAVYSTELKNNHSKWVPDEYKLRSWKRFYGVDIADEYSDIDTELVRQRSRDKKIVFICHWPEIVNRLLIDYPNITVVSLFASTNQEADWQVSQYISKVGINNLQNFSFENNIQEQKENFILQHGLEAYQQFNSLNMHEVLKSRKNNYSNNKYITINISELQANQWFIRLAHELNIHIDQPQACNLSELWRSLCPGHIEYWKLNESN